MELPEDGPEQLLGGASQVLQHLGAVLDVLLPLRKLSSPYYILRT